MDDFLDRSDQLQTEILGLLSEVQVYPGIRFEAAFVACGIALEHGLSLRLLIKAKCSTSALSLMRLQFEGLTRGLWLLYAATDQQVDALSADLTLEAESTAKKLPMFSAMLAAVVSQAPPEVSRLLLNFKEVNGHALNSYVHTGIHPMKRYVEGYPEGLIRDVIRNSNGINILTGRLAVILTGDPNYQNFIQALQIKHTRVLPPLD